MSQTYIWCVCLLLAVCRVVCMMVAIIWWSSSGSVDIYVTGSWVVNKSRIVCSIAENMALYLNNTHHVVLLIGAKSLSRIYSDWYENRNSDRQTTITRMNRLNSQNFQIYFINLWNVCQYVDNTGETWVTRIINKRQPIWCVYFERVRETWPRDLLWRVQR